MTRSGRLTAGVRFRTTLFATSVVAVALAVGLVALLLLARSAFETAIENAAIAVRTVSDIATSSTESARRPAC